MTSEQSFPKTCPATAGNRAAVEIFTHPTASAIASELRKLADALDKGGETPIPKANLWWHFNSKEELVSLVKLLPKPLTKRIDPPSCAYPYLIIEREHPLVEVDVRGPQYKTCTLIEPARPAKYRCDPILAELEEDELSQEVA